MATEAQPEPCSMQVFNHGYALIRRPILLPARPDGGEEPLPLCKAPSHSCNGTVWLDPPPDTTVHALATDNAMLAQEPEPDTPCTNHVQLLQANIDNGVVVLQYG